MVITVFHTGIPNKILSKLSKIKSLKISLDDNESTPNILILYNPDIDVLRERISALNKSIQTNTICIYSEQPSLREISDIMISNVSLIATDDISPTVFINSLKSIISSNIYNAAQRSKKWEGIKFQIAENITYSPSKSTIIVNGTEHKLNKKEQHIMNILCDNAGKYINKKELLTTIWGNTTRSASRSFDVYINRLRHILDTGNPTILKKIRGTGYSIQDYENIRLSKNKY